MTEHAWRRVMEEQHKEEVAEFNAGWEAGVRGEPPNEPEGMKWDVWLIGYAWAFWPEEHELVVAQRKEIERLRAMFVLIKDRWTDGVTPAMEEEFSWHGAVRDLLAEAAEKGGAR